MKDNFIINSIKQHLLEIETMKNSNVDYEAIYNYTIQMLNQIIDEAK